MAVCQSTFFIVLMMTIGTQINTYAVATNDALPADQPSSKHDHSYELEVSEQEKLFLDSPKTATLVQSQALQDEKFHQKHSTSMLKSANDVSFNSKSPQPSVKNDLTYEEVLEKASHHPDDLLGVLTKTIPKDKLEKLMRSTDEHLHPIGSSNHVINKRKNATIVEQKDKSAHSQEQMRETSQTEKMIANSLTFEEVLQEARSDPEDLLGKLLKDDPSLKNFFEKNNNTTNSTYKKRRRRRRRSSLNKGSFQQLVQNAADQYKTLLKTGCLPIPWRTSLKDVMPKEKHHLTGNVEFLPPAIEMKRCARWICNCEDGKLCLPRKIEVIPLHIIAFQHTTSHKVMLDVDQTIDILNSLLAPNNSSQQLVRFKYKVISHKQCECKRSAEVGCAKPFTNLIISTNKHECVCDERYAEKELRRQGQNSSSESVHQYCKDYLEGNRIFANNDYVDIVNGNVQEPQCSYGDFNVISQSCPKKEY